MKIPKSLKNKKLVFIVLCTLTLLLVGVLTYAYRSKNNHDYIDNQGINYAPPNDQEKKETEEFKNKQIDDYNKSQSISSTSNQGDKKVVTPIIVSVGQYGESINTNAFIQGVVEDEGQCNFTFSKDTKSVTKSSAGFINATTTTCTPITFSKADLGVGVWSAVLNYSSPTSSGVSQPSTLQVK